VVINFKLNHKFIDGDGRNCSSVFLCLPLQAIKKKNKEFRTEW